MIVIHIAGNAVRRLVRDRSNLFFVFVFPLALILLIGAAFGGAQRYGIAVVADDVGPLGEELVTALEAREDLDLHVYETASAAREAVSRGLVDAAVILPDGYDVALRSGQRAEIGFIGTPNTTTPALQTILGSAVADQAGLLAAADLVSSVSGLDFATSLDRARTIEQLLPGVHVQSETVGTNQLAEEFENLGQFDLGASTQLALFVFLTSLTGAATLIQNRDLGVTRRMLAAPVTSRQIILGEGLGRVAVALVQGLYIMLGTVLLFGVSWGDPLAAIALLAVFALVSAAAAMLAGALMRSQEQAGGLGVGLGIGLAALGGAMVPVEVMPPVMQSIAKVTPHAWVIDGYAELVRRGGGLGDVTLQLAVLAAMAVALFAVGGRALQRTLTH